MFSTLGSNLKTEPWSRSLSQDYFNILMLKLIWNTLYFRLTGQEQASDMSCMERIIDIDYKYLFFLLGIFFPKSWELGQLQTRKCNTFHVISVWRDNKFFQKPLKDYLVISVLPQNLSLLPHFTHLFDLLCNLFVRRFDAAHFCLLHLSRKNIHFTKFDCL